MPSRDFYDILKVTKKATADEIKSAYRKLARQLHPDVNKAADAQKKFTEVQNAYDVLSDEKKRGIYDQFGPAAFETGASQEAASRSAGSGGGGGGGPGGGGRGPHYSWQNVGQRGGSSSGGGNAGSVNANGVDFDPDDLSSIFETMFGAGGFGGAGANPVGGAGGGGGRGRKKATSRRARSHQQEEPAHEPLLRDLEVDFTTIAKGGLQTMRLGSGGTVKTLEVKIPQGIDSGSVLRIRGGGPQDEDVLLTIKAQSHKYFRRGEYEDLGKGLDLYVDVPVSIAEATLGGAIPVPTLDGQADLAVPAGTASGRKLRLRGQGIHDAAGRKGDLYAVIRIMPPTSAIISEEEAAMLRSISERGGRYRSW